MNDRKDSSLIIYDLEDNNRKKDESLEEYQIIKEDYCSSPKCGIRSKIVTKSVDKIIFSPIEISTNPYFKYSVTPVKNEILKCDFSQSETNHTRIQEEIKSKKNINNISNNPKISFIEIIKDELKEEKNENESENGEKIMSKSNLCQLLDKKKYVLPNKDSILQERSAIIKSRKINLYKISSFNINNIHHSINLKEKIQLSLNDNIKEPKKTKISQKIMHNLLMLNNENSQNNKISKTDMINLKYNIGNNNKPKANSLLNSLKLKNENIKSIKKKNSPFTIAKERKEPIKVKSSLTSTNIKRIIKKQKRSQENGFKKLKTTHDIHFDPNINNVNKSKREKNKNKTTNKDKCNDNSGENKKEGNMDFSKNNNKEILILNKPKNKRSKHKKMKSFGEQVFANINKETNKHNENEDKNKSKEKDKDDSNDNFPKRRTNNFLYYKLNMDDSLKKQKNIFEMPNTAKRRRRSIFDFNLDDNKKKNILINLRKEKESKESLTSKKKSAFSNKIS